MRNFETDPIKKLIDAVKYKCQHDCCCDDYDSWVNCPVNTCALWPYRLGENPFNKKTFSEEEKQKRSERMRNRNLARNSQ